ncbi:unnamed protein product [Colias eurytheme]|nr:unnamed protein product [Colias eurytheme]
MKYITIRLYLTGEARVISVSRGCTYLFAVADKAYPLPVRYKSRSLYLTLHYRIIQHNSTTSFIARRQLSALIINLHRYEIIVGISVLSLFENLFPRENAYLEASHMLSTRPC